MSGYNSLIKLWKEKEIFIMPGDDRDGIKKFLARNPNLSLVAVEGNKIIGPYWACRIDVEVGCTILQ